MIQKIEDQIRKFKQSKDTMIKILSVKNIEEECKKLRKELLKLFEKENR